MEDFQITLDEMVNLTHLSINLNNQMIENEGCDFITECVRDSLTKIEELNLDLDANQIEDEGFVRLMKSFKKIPTLKKVNICMAFNKITKAGLKELSLEL